METVIDCISDAKPSLFSTLDLGSAFQQLSLDKSTAHKTAFSTQSNHYQFRTLPFGLKNAPSHFQKCMSSVLKDINMKKCLIYLDDIILFGSDFNSHLQDLQLVFDRLREAGLTLKMKKCTFFQKEVHYLGQIFTPDGVKPNPNKSNG